MTQYQNILIAFETPIVTLTISREKALNALNAVTMNELAYLKKHLLLVLILLSF